MSLGLVSLGLVSPGVKLRGSLIRGSLIRGSLIRGWPTIYVLDPKGVIRYKGVREKLMDEAVDTLLEELEKDRGSDE